MTTFDPTKPVMVHEQIINVEVERVPVTPEQWESGAKWHDTAQTVIVWHEMLLDRWWPASESEAKEADAEKPAAE